MGSGRENWSREYFARSGTVEGWWDPLSPDDEATRSWFLVQLASVIELIEPADKSVLDAATGRGRAAIASAMAGAASVVGVDISAEMLTLARSDARDAGVADRVVFERADLTSLPFPDQSFERVLLLEVLLHFDDPDAVLLELHRVLLPGGRLVMTTNGANPLVRLRYPARKAGRQASRLSLAGVTAANELLTALFGFGWRRTPLTAAAYRGIFNVPVRPIYPLQARRMLRRAGFQRISHRAVPNAALPREHHWAAEKPL
ncbi:MAG: class I SAM-dependent methyltransferase [Gaiellaceae bacterium]